MAEISILEELRASIPRSLLNTSGSVFYSGRTAFSSPSKVYILGLNPGGSPFEQRSETVSWHTEKVLRREPANWSAYRDERWKGYRPGTYGMQPRVLHFLRYIELDPGLTPSSNIVFERSAREQHLKDRFTELADLCWSFHQLVINRLGIRIIICFGKTAGEYVRMRLEAYECVDEFIEDNNRRWCSRSYLGVAGIGVVIATHPSIADWTVEATDPSPMVVRLIERLT